MSSTDDTKRYIQPMHPYPSNQTTTGIIGVSLNDDEEVEWHWLYFPDGSRVATGYTIYKKHLPVNKALQPTTYATY